MSKFLGYADGYLKPTIPARRDVAAAIRRHRPEVVVTLDPSTLWSSDGYITPGPPFGRRPGAALGQLGGFDQAVGPVAAHEGLEPGDVAELWMMTFGTGDAVVDISETFVVKLAALRAHVSQLGEWEPEPLMREVNEALGRGRGSAAVEGFTVLRWRA